MSRREGQRGQALVEGALAIVLFITLAMGVMDLGRAAYEYNGLSNLARETSHYALQEYTSDSSSYCYWNSFSQLGCISTLKRYALGLQMVPGISSSNLSMSLTIDCGSSGNPCTPGIPLSISVGTQFRPILTALLGIGPFSISASSTSQFVLPVATPTPSTATATPCAGTCPSFTPVPTNTATPPEGPPSNLQVTAANGCTSQCQTFTVSWTAPTNSGAVGHYTVSSGSIGSYQDADNVPGTMSGSPSTTTDVSLGSPTDATCFQLTAVYYDGQEFPINVAWHDANAQAPTC